MRRLRRSRQQVVGETIASLAGLIASAVVLIVVFGDLTIRGRITVIGTALVAYAAIVMIIWALGRRRSRRRRTRLDKVDRRSLKEALDGSGRLPRRADETWRDELRQEAMGQSFPAVWMQTLGTFVVLLVILPIAQEGWPSLTELVLTVAAVTAVSGLVAAGVVAFGRPRVRNALSMLDQLDARAAERADR